MRKPHSGNTCGFKVSDGHELMNWQSEIDDVIVVQLAPATAVDAGAAPASDPVAAPPASSLPVEMLGTMHAGAARTGSVRAAGTASPSKARLGLHLRRAARILRIMAPDSHHTAAPRANFLPAPRSRTVGRPR